MVLCLTLRGCGQLSAEVAQHSKDCPPCVSWQHGGIYVKRSARFNEQEMRRRLQSYVRAGTPVSLRAFPLFSAPAL